MATDPKGDVLRVDAIIEALPPTYEWRAVRVRAGDNWTSVPMGTREAAQTVADCGRGWIERRTAPGAWERVPDDEGRRDG